MGELLEAQVYLHEHLQVEMRACLKALKRELACGADICTSFLRNRNRDQWVLKTLQRELCVQCTCTASCEAQ